jgi:hypothetical protein
MLSLSSDAQFKTYASLRSLEARAMAVDDLISGLKRNCLQGKPEAVLDLISATAEVRWQLQQMAEIANELEEELGVSRSGDELPAPRTGGRSEQGCMRGSTDVMSVADIVNVLSQMQKTGTLALHSRDAMFVFEFEEGKIVHAITNRPDPELRLGTILVAQNVLNEEQLQECLDASAQANALLGSHLVHSATVSEDDLRAALDVQVRMIFDAAFALRSAQFTFLEGNLSNIAQRTALNTTQLLLEAARQEDEVRLRAAQCDTSATKGEIDSILKD